MLEINALILTNAAIYASGIFCIAQLIRGLYHSHEIAMLIEEITHFVFRALKFAKTQVFFLCPYYIYSTIRYQEMQHHNVAIHKTQSLAL